MLLDASENSPNGRSSSTRCKSATERVLRAEPDAHVEAFQKLNPLTQVSEIGTRATFRSHGDAVAVAILVHPEDVVPGETKSLLQSGKLSTKAMPKGRYYEIYQEHV